MTNETALLLKRSQSGDEKATETLLRENSGLIWSIVKRFYGRGVEADDLYQLGCVGFLKAISGFDCAYGTQFSTYAVPKIAGEIKRFLRDDGSIKVSRGIKEQAAAIHAVRQELFAKNGQEPTVSQIAEKLDMTAEEIAMADAANFVPKSIQQDLNEDGFSLENMLANEPMEEIILQKISLQDAIEKLEKREQLVISLRYQHALTQQKVADVLSVSQVQVSRIEKKALFKLRSLI